MRFNFEPDRRRNTVVQFPARGPFVVRVINDRDGWLVVCRSHGWLHGDQTRSNSRCRVCRRHVRRCSESDIMTPEWIERARNVPIETVINHRGIKLRGKIERVGPCPKCGGEDRFSINTKKGLWNCRQCGVGGDVIKLIEHLDNCGFIDACTTLTGEPPPKANGKDRTGTKPRKIVAAEYPYHDQFGTLAFVVERIEYQSIPTEISSTRTASAKKPSVKSGPILIDPANGFGMSMVCRLCRIAWTKLQEQLSPVIGF